MRSIDCPAGTDLELVREPKEEGVVVGGKFWPYDRIYRRPDGTAFSIHPDDELAGKRMIHLRPCTEAKPCCSKRLEFDSHTGRGERITCPTDCVCHT